MGLQNPSLDRMTIQDVELHLRMMENKLVRPMWLDRALCSLRSSIVAALPAGTNAIGNITTVTTVTTVSTLTNQVNMAGFGIKDTHLNHEKRMAWSLGVRARIS